MEGNEQEETGVMNRMAELAKSTRRGRRMEAMARELGAEQMGSGMTQQVEVMKEWFKDKEGASCAKESIQIAEEGVRARIDLSMEERKKITQEVLKKGNHSSYEKNREEGRQKLVESLINGKAILAWKSEAEETEGVLLSPMGMTDTDRAYMDCSYAPRDEDRYKAKGKRSDKERGEQGKSLNGATDFSECPENECGSVVKAIIELIVGLRGKFGTKVRMVAGKVDVKGAFKHIKLYLGAIECFCYIFGEWLVIELVLPFGWRNSPGWWQLVANGIQQAHNSLDRSYTPTEEAVRWAEDKLVLNRTRENRQRKAVDPNTLVNRLPKGGGKDDKFSAKYYVDDGTLVELVWCGGLRLRIAAAAIADCTWKVLGYPKLNLPPAMADNKITDFDSVLEEWLGWYLDLDELTLSLSMEKARNILKILEEWTERKERTTSRQQVLSLAGKLMHVSFIHRAGKYFLWRVLHLTGLRPAAATVEGQKQTVYSYAEMQRTVRISEEAIEDLWLFKGIVKECVQGRLSLTGQMMAHIKRAPEHEPASDASFIGMGGQCQRLGVYWCYRLTEEQLARIIEPNHRGEKAAAGHVWTQGEKRSDGRRQPQQMPLEQALYINLLELVGIMMTAWVLHAVLGLRPREPAAGMCLRADNQCAVAWVKKKGGVRRRREGGCMRMLGGLEIMGGWTYDTAYLEGKRNNIADDTSRLPEESLTLHLNTHYPLDPHTFPQGWKKLELGEAGRKLICEALAQDSDSERWGLQQRLSIHQLLQLT
jgi:hypothetical protein